MGASVTYPAVRRAGKALVTGIGAVVIGLALLVSGCGEDEPERSALAESLAQLCEQARADTEELGLPADEGFKVMAPTAAIGIQLGKDIGKLEGTTETEKEQIASLAKGIAFYYGELEAAVKLYTAGYRDAYAVTLDRAKGELLTAEALATRMGAPECAVRPFPDR